MKMFRISWVPTCIAVFTLASPANASPPTCNVSQGTPYCAYTGRVARAYINASNIILLYFDSTFDLSRPVEVGYEGVTSATAAAIRLSDNPDFAKSVYSTMLTAQARGATVTVQMRGLVGGYAKIDRIWIYE